MDSDSQKTGYAEKEFDTIPAPGAGMEKPEAVNPAGKKKHTFVSKGEHIHKWTAYLSIDWILNSFSGVGFAYWANYSETGKKYWSGPITKILTEALKPLIKNDERRAKSVDKGNMFMGIVAGGMFTIPPLLVLENKKVKLSIVKFLDRHIYGKDKVEHDPKFKEAYDEIVHAPKKKFWRGLFARAVALSPLIASIMVPTARKFSDKYYYNHLEHASDSMARKIGLSPEKSFRNIPFPDNKDGILADGKTVHPWKFIHASLAMDFGMSIFYAILHAFFYNMFSAIGKKPKNTNPEASEPQVQAKTVTDIKESKPEQDEKLSPQYVTRETDRRNTVPAPHSGAVSV